MERREAIAVQRVESGGQTRRGQVRATARPFFLRGSKRDRSFMSRVYTTSLPIAVGPANRSDSGSNFVPFNASFVSRFFVTLYPAPASRI